MGTAVRSSSFPLPGVNPAPIGGTWSPALGYEDPEAFLLNGVPVTERSISGRPFPRALIWANPTHA